MIHGRYHKKKTKIKNNLRGILKNRVHITVVIPFFEMPYRLVGRKVMLCKELSDYTRKLGAGLYAVMLPNRTGTDSLHQNVTWLESNRPSIEHHIYMCRMLMSSYHKAPEIWLKLQVKISSDCILTCVIHNLQEMGMREYCKFEIPSLVPTSLFYPHMVNKTMLLDFGIEDRSKLLGSQTPRIKPFLSDMDKVFYWWEISHCWNF